MAAISLSRQSGETRSQCCNPLSLRRHDALLGSLVELLLLRISLSSDSVAGHCPKMRTTLSQTMIRIGKGSERHRKSELAKKGKLGE